ncbi:MAG: hypothetical protein Q9162_004753 [Coniocarpon cinnabarinum]
MKSIPALAHANIQSFRRLAFEAGVPRRLPPGAIKPFVPAIRKWFRASNDANISVLDDGYFTRHDDFNVPVEMTQMQDEEEGGQTSGEACSHFHRGEMSMAQFVATAATQADAKNRLYIAQCPVSNLPSMLQHDLPSPDLVREAGRGDIYDSSIWLGMAPTYTPLHKDPNPNLFVQLAGRKSMRIFEPAFGRAVFEEAQRRSGGRAAAAFRGEEMMQGSERQIMEALVWGDDDAKVAQQTYTVELETGEGLFIPKGWWHSIKGMGEGINGSVNWWFR